MDTKHVVSMNGALQMAFFERCIPWDVRVGATPRFG